MNTQIIVPDNEQHWLALRTKDVTSTESPALFGISPYTTMLELFYRKKENVAVGFQVSERMKWGNRLQDAIASGVAEDQGLAIRKMTEYIRDPELRMGSSFDYAIGDDGILEVKNVDAFAFKEGWEVDGDVLEAPPAIEMQVQHQLAVSGRKFAMIAALVGGNRVALLKREPDETVITALKVAVSNFWAAVGVGAAPTPDFTRDADVIARLYAHSTPGKVLLAEDDSEILSLAWQYREAQEAAKAAELAKDEAKAKLLMKIQDNEKVIGKGFSISAGIVKGGPVSYERADYRNFRVTWKKEKAV